ncbi:hypothetical protein [Asanoa sp. NPDC050611]|uniref:hypothetical protein n=1 Tax=Asanoa sp. NPDC050611 TaxID=3157098 RepID=UPI0033DC6331
MLRPNGERGTMGAGVWTRKATAFVIVVLVAGLSGCMAESAPPPPVPTPSVSVAPSPSETGPAALMATIGRVIDEGGLGNEIEQREIEPGGSSHATCDLLIAEPDAPGNADWLPLDADWSAGIDVDPVTSIGGVYGPKTIMEIRVFHLHDAVAAAAAAAKVRAAACSKADFGLTIGMATARRGSRTVAIGSTQARLTSATVKRVNPEIEESVTYLPGDVKLAFAHGSLLISIETLAIRSRKANSPTEITAAAEKRASKTATAIVNALPVTR